MYAALLQQETMNGLDFMEFRDFLESGSGFESVQFRLLENKIGILDDNRVLCNRENYKSVSENNLIREYKGFSREQYSWFIMQI